MKISAGCVIEEKTNYAKNNIASHENVKSKEECAKKAAEDEKAKHT